MKPILASEDCTKVERMILNYIVFALFHLEAVQMHNENHATTKVKEQLDKFQNGLMAIVKILCEEHKCDPEATFEYWLDHNIPTP